MLVLVIIGLFVGCFLVNLYGMVVSIIGIYDVIFGFFVILVVVLFIIRIKKKFFLFLFIIIVNVVVVLVYIW